MTTLLTNCDTLAVASLGSLYAILQWLRSQFLTLLANLMLKQTRNVLITDDKEQHICLLLYVIDTLYKWFLTRQCCVVKPIRTAIFSSCASLPTVAIIIALFEWALSVFECAVERMMHWQQKCCLQYQDVSIISIVDSETDPHAISIVLNIHNDTQLWVCGITVCRAFPQKSSIWDDVTSQWVNILELCFPNIVVFS